MPPDLNLRHTIFSELREIIVEELSVKPHKVTPLTRFDEDLDAVELDLWELFLAFQEHFNLIIPDEVAETLPRVHDVVEFIATQREALQ